MKISDILKNKRTLSFEFFPPRVEQGVERLFETIDHLKRYEPDFIDITYGAGGSTQRLTVELCVRAYRDSGVTVMGHLTCSAQTKEMVHGVLKRFESEGIENVILLRGDPPQGEDIFVPAEDGFSHATDLVQHTKENFDFGIAAACYPEAHPESLDADSDLYYTKMKVEQGAEFLITQLFYDNEDYYAFVDRARQSGIDVPIIPGLMPILNASQIRRITSLCGATIPAGLDRQLERHADDNRAVRQIGIDHTLRQAQELMASDVPGIHFYVLNRRYSITKILDNLQGSSVGVTSS